jgi:ketosteroid isomerase-like protein
MTDDHDLNIGDTVRDGFDPEAINVYLSAFNSNSVEALLEVVAEDITLLPPGLGTIRGKRRLGVWLQERFAVGPITWTKQSQQLITTGDMTYEWYRYTLTEESTRCAETITVSGDGMHIYHRGSDGVWRVSCDTWVEKEKALLHHRL